MNRPSPQLRVPREAGLVCVITWTHAKFFARCTCGWEMDRPSLADIHDHVVDPGFNRVCTEGRYYAFVDAEGRYHRTNGPAVVPVTPQRGVGDWYRHGKLHREDGPAVVSVPGMPEFNEWWFEGEQVHPDTNVDGYYEVQRALEESADHQYLLPMLDTMLKQAVLDGLVRGAAMHRVD